MPEQGLIEDVVQLRAIIHGLKMAGLSFVDQEALTSIQQRIKNLPSPEMLTSFSGKKEEIKNVAKEVGEIIQLIEIYGKRNEESKQRSMSTKGLPPRYKTLEWRQAMNKNVVIRELVNASSLLDKHGQVKLASRLINVARSVKEDKATENDVVSIVNEVSASVDQNLLKEAGLSDMWAGLKGGLGGAWQGAKNMGHQIADPAKTSAAFARAMQFLQGSQKNLVGLLDILKKSHAFVYNPGMKNTIAQIHDAVAGLQTNSEQIAQQLQQMQLGLKQTTVPVDEQDQEQEQDQTAQPPPLPSQGEADKFAGISDEDLQAEIAKRQQRARSATNPNQASLPGI